MRPDAIVKVRFRTEVEGGRRKPVWGPHFGCPMEIGNEKFDCRLYPGGRTLEAGTLYEVAVKFLCPDNAKPKLSRVGEFTLWEGRTIADGQLVRICNGEDCEPIVSSAPEGSSAAAV